MEATPRSSTGHTSRELLSRKRTLCHPRPLLGRLLGWFRSPLDRLPRTSEPLELYRQRMRTVATFAGVDHA